MSDVYVEHRWPKKRRESYPQMFVLWYTLRRIVFFTPQVGLRAWQIQVSTLPRRAWLIGFDAYRDEDDDLIVRFGLGVLDVEVTTVRFLPESYWSDLAKKADGGLFSGMTMCGGCGSAIGTQEVHRCG